jgi:hypothetical protein
MNLPWLDVLFVLGAVGGVWLALLWCWTRRGKSRRPGTWAKVIAGTATVLLLFVPVGGVPLWNRVFSFYPNPSLPMLGVVSAALWSRLFGLAVFRRSEWSAIWIFGAVVGSALYLQSTSFGMVDLYYWGWDREAFAWVIAAGAAAFLACGSRCGVLLLAALVAYSVTALESQNGWDYVIDPFYWMISVGVLVARGLGDGFRAIEKRLVVHRLAATSETANPAPVPTLPSLSRESPPPATR